jgi:hypothetical protein
MKPQSVQRSKQFNLGYKTNQFMLYRTKVTVCSEIHAKQINTVEAERTHYGL